MAKRSAQDSLRDAATMGSRVVKKAKTRDPVSQDPSHTPNGNGNGTATTAEDVSPQLSERQEKSPINGHDKAVSSEDEVEESSAAQLESKRQLGPSEGYHDLYLDTIDRAVLDFDFEKLCSISLSNLNVYACLVCGKYFQGRGPKSHAYFHALEAGHHVYVNMKTQRVYVLPEGYEVKSKSLDDIRFVVDPKLSRAELRRLDHEPCEARDLAGKVFRPGFVGMNNIKANDYFNVIVQTLSHVPPIRDLFILGNLPDDSELVQRLSVLIRKIWNTRAFKTHVSPHELLQQISRQSNKRFDLLHQSDPVDFLSWLLNNLHLALGGSKTRPLSSKIQTTFQGRVKIESQQITARADAGDRLRFEDADVDQSIIPYMLLTLDLPAAPLFQDELDKNIIPQVSLTTLLSKYDGRRPQEHMNQRKRHRLLHPLPPYLVFHIKRFSKNKFVTECNPTIVTFSTRSLDISPYVEPNPALHPPGEPLLYDLVANVTHEAVKTRDDSVEGEAERRVWRCQVRDRARGEWYEIQDLFVERVPAETLFTKESYLMVWERRKPERS